MKPLTGFSMRAKAYRTPELLLPCEECEHEKLMISPPENGEFESAIRRAVERFKPRNVIETGTCIGTGTTRILHEALSEIHGDQFTLVTIESSKDYWRAASVRYANHPEVVCLHGLSIPRDQLPGIERIKQTTVDETIPGIYYDHPPHIRPQMYFQEQQCDGADKQLWIACGVFGRKPDLVLLDSAGHLGFEEFKYLMSLVKGPFVLVLDDVNHIKHYRTAGFIGATEGWEIIERGNERFGWLVAKWKGPSNSSTRS